MRHDRFAAAGGIAVAAVVAGSLLAFATYAADAPPGPPAWVAARTSAGPAAAPPASPIAAPPVSAAIAASPPPAAGTDAAANPPAANPPAANPPAVPAPLPVTASAPIPPTAGTVVAASSPAAQPAPEHRGVGCVVGGTIASVGVFVYGDILAALGGEAGRALLLPAMATGFVVGCNVGASLTPGLNWIARHLP